MKSKLVKCSSITTPDNLIGAAVYINPRKQAKHAGIFIRYNGKNKLFHYDGLNVLLEDYDNDQLYVVKEIDFIHSSLIPSIVMHCELVLEKASPLYGYFYMGSMYNESGDFISEGNMPEYMTCVGFCLNYFKYILKGKDFFNYLDWTSLGLGEKEGFVESFINEVQDKFQNIDINMFQNGIRRINPLEYLTGAFSEKIPVRKEFVDKYAQHVQNEYRRLIA
jgi:hypothetical protein